MRLDFQHRVLSDKIFYDYMPTEGYWQYGDNSDIEVVEEGDMLVAYLVDAAASTYRKLEIQL